MKDFLQDIVAHTHALGVIPAVKITATDDETLIEAMADDRSVIIQGKTLEPVNIVKGVFGLPNLSKLDNILKCPEYKENEQITVTSVEKDGETYFTGLHFENEKGDYQNDYRFMSGELVSDKIKSVKFKGVTWDVEFEPTLAAIQRLKYQASVHNEEIILKVSTRDDNLIFNFGDASTHAGSFIFQNNISGKLKNIWPWPVSQTLSILNLSGEMTMKISDSAAMQITVKNSIAEYNYILPAYTK